MIFNSLAFFVFIGIFFPLYFLTKGKTRLWICLLGSYFFYGWWDWRFLGLIAVSSLFNYLMGLHVADENRRHRKFALILACLFNLFYLGFFKYFNFFIDSLNSGLGMIGHDPRFDSLRIILPVGISFFTFQSMSYVIDVYRKQLRVERSLLTFATFVAFFPQLVAGPIVRASTLIPQLNVDQRLNWDRLVSGVNLIVWGYVMKVGVADSLAFIADSRFAFPGNHGSLSLMIGVLFYTFQIYGDFCGYSSIAIGIGRILGFDFGVNFDRPYFSKSFSEFWTRWHVSLSSWLRDYLYIPLGGNRKGKRRTQINLMTTMLLGGLWHGAGWNFVFWGFLHGLYLVFQRILSRPFARGMTLIKCPNLIRDGFLILSVFVLTMLAWVFFRSQNFNDAFYIIGEIIKFDDMSFMKVSSLFQVLKGLGLIMGLVFVEILSFQFDFNDLAKRFPFMNLLFIVGCLILLSLLGTYKGNAFIYFQF